MLERAAVIGQALEEGLRGAYEARNDAELDAAGRALAPAISGTVVTLIEVLVTKGAFKVAEAAALRRFPMPEWFQGRVDRARRRVEARERRAGGPGAEGESGPKPAEKTPAEKPASPESRPGERTERPGRAEDRSKNNERARSALKTARGTLALEGGRRTAQTLDQTDFVALGIGLTVLLAAGVGVTAALVARKRS